VETESATQREQVSPLPEDLYSGLGFAETGGKNGRHSAGEASLDRRSEEYSHPERRTVLHRTFADAEWRAVGVEALDGAAALNACIPTPAG